MGTERGTVAQRDVDLDVWLENLNDGLLLTGKTAEPVNYVAIEKVRGRPPRSMRLYSESGNAVSLMPPFGLEAWQALIAEFGDGTYHLRPRCNDRFVGQRIETVSGVGPGARRLDAEPLAGTDHQGIPEMPLGGAPLALDDPRREIIEKRAAVQGKKLDADLIRAERDLERERHGPTSPPTPTPDPVMAEVLKKTLDRAFTEPPKEPPLTGLLEKLLPALIVAATNKSERDPLMAQIIQSRLNEPSPLAAGLELVRHAREAFAPEPPRGIGESLREILTIASELGLRRGRGDDTPGWVLAVERLGPALAQPLTEWARTAQMLITARAGAPLAAPALASSTVPPAGLAAVQARVAFASSVNDETEFSKIADEIGRHVQQGIEFLGMIRAGQLPPNQALEQLRGAGLVPPGADTYVLRFLQWVRTSWASAVAPPPDTSAQVPPFGPRSQPAPLVIQCDRCGAEYECDTEADFVASDKQCDAPTPLGPCGGTLWHGPPPPFGSPERSE